MISGPNGSGKSTLSEWVDLAGRGLLLDPDAIARAINPLLTRSAAIPAGREVLRLIEEYIGRRETLAVETTLSSNASLKLIEYTRDQGYEVHLIFVALESPERCIMRIQNRVVDGALHSGYRCQAPIPPKHGQLAGSDTLGQHGKALRQFGRQASPCFESGRRDRYLLFTGVAQLGSRWCNFVASYNAAA
jgi:hypothetical protein